MEMPSAELIILMTATFSFFTTMIGGLLYIWREIRIMHRMVNSRMDEQLALTKNIAHAAGFKEGKRSRAPMEGQNNV